MIEISQIDGHGAANIGRAGEGSMPATLDCKLAIVRLEDFQAQGDIVRTVGGYATAWPLAGLLSGPVLEVLEFVRGALGE